MSGKRTVFVLVGEEPLRLGLELGHVFELWHPEDLEHGVPKEGKKALCKIQPGSYSLLSRPVHAQPAAALADTDDPGTYTPKYMAYSVANPACGAALAIIDPDSAPPRKFP